MRWRRVGLGAVVARSAQSLLSSVTAGLTVNVKICVYVSRVVVERVLAIMRGPNAGMGTSSVPNRVGVCAQLLLGLAGEPFVIPLLFGEQASEHMDAEAMYNIA